MSNQDIMQFFPSQEKPDAPAIHVSPDNATITFEDVSFSYTPDRPILNKLNFRVSAGDKFAVVGGSGSG